MDDLLLVVQHRRGEETILFCPGEDDGLHIEADEVYTATVEEERRLWDWLNRRREARIAPCDQCGQALFKRGHCPCNIIIGGENQ